MLLDKEILGNNGQGFGNQTVQCKLNSLLKMSLGVGALKVSGGGPIANSREEVSMATLEARPPLEQPVTDHHTE